MLPDPQDTIVALASASGPGARAIIRLSGPQAWEISTQLFTQAEPIGSPARQRYEGQLYLPGICSPLPADLYFWPQPHSYTGQDVAELHTISSQPLVELLIAQLMAAGARAAQPGEFTMRAFLSGKLNLTQVEAVPGIIEANNRDQLKQALTQLAGGVSQPLQKLRSNLLDLLADVEAGLDFTEEDLRFVDKEELLRRLAEALAHVTLVSKQLDQRVVSTRPFRAVLAGPPNAGKSSLFNALAGTSKALVSPEPGTTRDYLLCTLNIEGVQVELADTAGRQEASDALEEQAQTLAGEQANLADLVLYCLESGREFPKTYPFPVGEGGERATRFVTIATKVDLCPLAEPEGQGETIATSAKTGIGLSNLRKLIAERARARAQSPLAPSLSRCRHHVETCVAHLRQAHAAVLHEEPAELLALELRGALDQLGEMVGAIYTDDLLDRIFSRFCIGK